jgi:hypothetical protein
MENRQTFFDFAAEAGLTKHFGGLESTEELPGYEEYAGRVRYRLVPGIC